MNLGMAELDTTVSLPPSPRGADGKKSILSNCNLSFCFLIVL
uniref:Uncharacterized protein n=1 Tax=Rhizophora mucronata TaxID=61149 RepID=A0A2P2Q0Z6_RHIMU